MSFGIHYEQGETVTDGGRRLRSLREKLGLTMRQVESASARVAAWHVNDEFSIPPSRLSDIETKGVVPSIYRLYSLCVLYKLSFLELLSWYGVPPIPAEIAKHQIDLSPNVEAGSIPAFFPGIRLRNFREHVVRITMRDVEDQSNTIAANVSNYEFSIPFDRLSDLETKGVVPSIYRFHSLSVIYKISIQSLLELYGVNPALVDSEYDDLGLSSAEFSISFAPDLTPQQIRLTLQALADYYRACGGIGFQIDFESEQVQIFDPEPAYV